MHSIGGGIVVQALCARASRPSSLSLEDGAALGVSGGAGRHERALRDHSFSIASQRFGNDTPFFVTSSSASLSTSGIAPIASTRSFFGGASVKRPQPADPVDHVAGSISVPHDAIERLSYLVQVRRPMIQNVPSGLSVSDYRRDALRRFSNIV